jgi:outer membrane lipoprotein-sorting protein
MLSHRAIRGIAASITVALVCGFVLAMTVVRRRGERGAEDIWRKSVQQGLLVPMRARLAVTLWKQGKTTATLARIVQSGKSRYSMTYEAPPEARGRVVYADGVTHWQYEPKRHIVIKTPLTAHSEENEATALIEQNYRFTLVSDRERVSGRPTYLLELTPIHDGKGKQRRWIDRQNFKTLRMETHYADGSLARTLAYQQASFPTQIPEAEFLPKFDKTARVVAQSGGSSPTPASRLAQRARALGLNANGTLGFQLTQATISAMGRASVAQLLYSDGIETVSVFVRSGRTTLPASLKGWSRLSLGKVTAYHQHRDHTDALVWTHNGHQYTAVSHLEPEALQAFVRGQLR